ncbi:MAG: hypothetical protein ACRBN8_45740 [Nannocystales bacterium]
MNPLESFVSAMTLAELSAKTGTSVADMVGFAVEGAAAPKAKTAKAPAASAAAPKPKAAAPKDEASATEVNTRTAEGRAAYDKAVRAWLKENASKAEPVAASAILAACGGTSLQGRTGLARLIEEKKAYSKGKARGTRYWAK